MIGLTLTGSLGIALMAGGVMTIAEGVARAAAWGPGESLRSSLQNLKREMICRGIIAALLIGVGGFLTVLVQW